MKYSRLSWLAPFLMMVAGFSQAHAQLMDLLTAPKTLIDRAIEARSAIDIAKDNAIVIEVNAIMAQLGTIKASTEIYEQRLLITGLFDDRKLYHDFEKRVRAIKGIKKLYWHVRYMSTKAQEKNAKRMIDWKDAIILDNKVGLKLVATKDVADVNFRVAADAFASIYLLGRARSKKEMELAVKVARETDGVRKVYNYVEVRP